MRFQLQIEPEEEEVIRATVHRRTELIDRIESLVRGEGKTDRLIGYGEEDWKELALEEIECILVQENKTYAIDRKGNRYRLKARLYEIEQQLPGNFFRINKSAIANRSHIQRFTVAFNGAVNVVFRCGYEEYVSRRCFRAIKERVGIK